VSRPAISADSVGDHPPRVFGWRVWVASLFLLPVLFAGAAVSYLVADDPIQVHAEVGFIEWAQTGVLGACVVLAALLAKRWQAERAAAAAWRGVIAFLAFVREQDLHEPLHPETLGSLGLHFRLDWWLDPAQPLGAKVLWALVAAAAAATVTLPIIAASPRPLRLLRAGDASAWLVAASAALTLGGWVLDDALRGWFPREPAQAMEELAELVAYVLFLASILALTEPRRAPSAAR